MDKKFLNKVTEQIISETRIYYGMGENGMGEIRFPFLFRSRFVFFFTSSFFMSSAHYLLPSILFSDHCKDVYGLNEDEIEYVWKEYKDDIVYKIDNNGL